MNNTTFLFNETAFNAAQSMQTLQGIPKECYNALTGTIQMNADCIIKNICPQISTYYIHAGYYMIFGYFALNLFAYWMSEIGYKNKTLSIFCNEHPDSRNQLRFSLLGASAFGLLGYAAIIIWFNTKTINIIYFLITLTLIKEGITYLIKKISKKIDKVSVSV
jgi:hypothetical protein